MQEYPKSGLVLLPPNILVSKARLAQDIGLKLYKHRTAEDRKGRLCYPGYSATNKGRMQKLGTLGGGGFRV